jgi:predicted CopG family antitoxin
MPACQFTELTGKDDRDRFTAKTSNNRDFFDRSHTDYHRSNSTAGEMRHSKSIHIYNAYNMIMSAVKRIPVTEPVWKELSEMRSAGQTYTELLEDLIETRKKDQLASDMMRIEEEGTFVPLSGIKD